ncbi:hypothetical protein BECAL_03185 [Bellilinea caldifistulae]|uniref:FHA domain-containing protein n=1 Tax=Bellilinea caldifistulae TaxID=360411 RepID=A0A0P6Y3X2_9CHLR|nr:FHA domain-containing protein [Bellilinea caldifistulae]KPL76309.1 hypothetical protein AC812_06475 [Bellilinea caldifistulae]GAP11985.1 hypothetical protein BECAL_03185 [Bellilinea caldifistulae]
MNIGRKNSHPHPTGENLLGQITLNMRGIWQRQSPRQQAGLLILVLAALLLSTLPLASLALSLNPYLPVIERVSGLLASQPGFEDKLAALEQFKTTLLPADLVQSVSEQLILPEESTPGLSDPTPEQLQTNTPDRQQLSAIAHSILTLQKSFEIPLNTPQLAVWLRQLNSEDALLRLQAVEGIYRNTPAVLRRLYDVRRANLTLIRQINSLTGDNGLNAFTLKQPISSPVSSLPDSTYISLIRLSRACQSVEIQLANTTYLLNQIFQEIEPVYRQDLLWGFSIWLKAAGWIWQQRMTLLILSLGLLVCSGLLLFWQSLSKNLRPGSLLVRFGFPRETPRPHAESRKAGHSFAAQSNWLVNDLARRHGGKPLQISRRGSIQRPHLLIPVSGKAPIEKPLPADGIVRIGNDPAFPVKIPLSGAEYIELWIRKARKGYYLEVMFSDIPVLINQEPVKSARTLNDGDTIQIHDSLLVFRER